MNWFKTLWLTSEEREILKKAKAEKGEKKVEEVKVSDCRPLRPYRSARLIGDQTLVVLQDGMTLTGGKELFEKVRKADSEEEILLLFTAKEEVKIVDNKIETKAEKELVRNNWEVLENHPNFVIKKDEVYLKGVNLPLPAPVAASFIEILEKLDGLDGMLCAGELGLAEEEDFDKLRAQYTSLKMFWLKLATSPRKESREQVLSFCKNNDIRLSKRGNIIGYRRINPWNSIDPKLNAFVEEKYNQIKLWKKGPSNYVVVFDKENGVFDIIRGTEEDAKNEQTYEVKGNLAELKAGLCENQEQLYTSKHNAGKYTFKIGDVYKADEGDIDTNAGNCASGGLHFAAVNYNYSSFGSVPVVVLVNPAKTITIPLYEMSKGRTVEMKVALINPNPHGVHIDESLIEQSDIEYNDVTITQLEEALVNKSFNDLCIKEEMPEISLPDLKEITAQLKDRVKIIS